MRLLKQRIAEQPPKYYMAKMGAEQSKQRTVVEDPPRAARLRALLLRMKFLQVYSTKLTGIETPDQVRSIVVAATRRSEHPARVAVRFGRRRVQNWSCLLA